MTVVTPPPTDGRRRTRPVALGVVAGTPLVGLLVWAAVYHGHPRHRAATRPTATTVATTRPTPLAATPTTRPQEAVLAEMQADIGRLGTSTGDPAALADPARRAAVAAVAVPLLRQLIDDQNELARLQPVMRPEGEMAIRGYRIVLSALDDPAATAALAAAAADRNLLRSARGRSAQLLARWIQAGRDPAGQAAVAADLVALAAARPGVAEVVAAVGGCAAGAVDPAVARSLRDAIRPPATRP